MQTRTITVDYARPRGYDIGYRAENNFTLLALPVPEELEGADSYRVYFESTVGEYLQTELLTPADGYVTVEITSDVVPEPGNMAAQLVAFADGEIVGYAPMITGSAKVSIPDGTERLSHSLAAEIALNTAARHTHSNKSVLDKFAETDGKPTYDGEALGGGGGASDFIIKMTVEGDNDGNYTVTSCDATVEQIDAAVAAEKRVVVIATDTTSGVFWEIPIVQAEGEICFFSAFLNGVVIFSYVQKVAENESKWKFVVVQIEAESVSYSNAALPNISTVSGALDALVPKSHTHSNKDTLDKLSDSNGKLQYNGSDVGLKGDKGDTPVKGTDYWTAADKQEIIDDIHPVYYIDLTGAYPNYTCPVAMDDITAAYNAGYNLVCRCQMGAYMATFPLFSPMPAANTWIFSGSGALQSMGFPAQSITIAITSNGVVAKQTLLNRMEQRLKIKVGDNVYFYDGSKAVNIVMDGITPTIGTNGNWYLGTTDTGKPSRGEKGDKGDPGSDANVTKDNVVAALGYTPEAVSAQVATGSNITLADNTEYRLADVTTLTLNYPAGNFECWMRLTFAASGNATVTLPTGTKYIGTTPDFKNGETWEMSIKDGVVIAQKVGDGT